MKRMLPIAGCIVLLIALFSAGLTISQSARSQDDYAQQIDELEARVTNLEATVEVLAGGGAEEGTTRTVRGTVTLSSDEGVFWTRTSGDDCKGTGSKRRYREGTKIWVDDWDGKEIASAELGTGRATSAGCTWKFSFELPVLDEYVFNVVNQEVAMDTTTLEENDWQVTLTMAG